MFLVIKAYNNDDDLYRQAVFWVYVSKDKGFSGLVVLWKDLKNLLKCRSNSLL
jgi:hypothetical protein